MSAIAIGVAAILGAPSRNALEAVLPNGQDGQHYLGTLTVNLSGAFAYGLIHGSLQRHFGAHPQLRNVLLVGFPARIRRFLPSPTRRFNSISETGYPWRPPTPSEL